LDGKVDCPRHVDFGFAGKDYLAVSIETRKEKGESYSTLAGFFRNYELYYMIADERGDLRVRTNYRQPQEDVYIYRINAPLENFRRVFLDYLKAINKLRPPGFLQHAHDQLHDQNLAAHPDESGIAAAFLENTAERLCARLSLRTEPGGYDNAVCGARKVVVRERACACCR
jgi:Domain of unknown function (DUF4105)